jgi:hypothetical protein
MPWSRTFDDPIVLPEGKALVSLKDAAAYIMALPIREAVAEPWQIAMMQLIDAAEDRGSIVRARTGMLRALNAGKPNPETVN